MERGNGYRAAPARRSAVRRIVSGIARVWVLYVWRPVRDFWRTVRRRHPVRVFTFHRLDDAWPDGMTVTEGLFRRQLDYVLRTHEVVTLEEALEMLRRGARLDRPVAVITFDDGYRSVFERAFPLMTELGVPGTAFVTTGYIETGRRLPHDENHPATEAAQVMGWNEILRLQMTGWTVGAHSETHPRLAGCSPEEVRRELARPLQLLRQCLGHDTIPLAFPFGGRDDFTEEHIRAARELGYAACFSNHGGENHPAGDAFHLRRIDIGGSHDALAWKVMVHGLSLDPWRSVWDRLLGRNGAAREG